MLKPQTNRNLIMSKLDKRGIVKKIFVGNSKRRVKRSPEFIESLLKSTDKIISESQDKAQVRCA